MFHYRKFIRLTCKPGIAWLTVLALTPVQPAFANTASQSTLTLADAEQRARREDPAVGALQARTRAMQDTAIADGQLPDPKLRTGIYNLPLDDFDASREPTSCCCYSRSSRS